jgi:hypothetical protein
VSDPISLYADLLGPHFKLLEPDLQRIHDDRAIKRYAGRCEIARDASAITSLLCALARLPPPSSDSRIEIVIERTKHGELWRRRFGAHAMTSSLSNQRGLLRERLGAMTLRFELQAERSRIVWRLKDAKLFGWIPVPARWLEACEASEHLQDGRYRFEVRAVLKGIGTLVHYRGWLSEMSDDLA